MAETPDLNTVKNNQRNRTEENISSDQSIDHDFEEWWKQNPHRVAKAAARREYIRARREKRATVDKLLGGAMRYAAELDEKFPMNPATWLRNERWLDEPLPHHPSVQDVARKRSFATLGHEPINGILESENL